MYGMLLEHAGMGTGYGGGLYTTGIPTIIGNKPDNFAHVGNLAGPHKDNCHFLI